MVSGIIVDDAYATALVQNAALAAGESAGVSLSLGVDGAVSGPVSNASSDFIENAWIRVCSFDPTPGKYMRSQADGTSEISGFETSAVYADSSGHTYAFYSIARDRLGHQETVKAAADTRARLVAPPADDGGGGGAGGGCFIGIAER